MISGRSIPKRSNSFRDVGSIRQRYMTFCYLWRKTTLMFDKEIYVQRRAALKSKINNGIGLFMGNREAPCNYKDNTYPFRQDSTFLYFFGLDEPDLAAVIDFET